MSTPLDACLSTWRADPIIAPAIAAWRTVPARPAQRAPLPPQLDPALASMLRARGITSLYSHQATAWEHATSGRSVVVVTGTASGKTLCYNLPVLDCLLRDPDARALYLFPTKALAQDQVAKLKDEIARIPSEDESTAPAESSSSEGILHPPKGVFGPSSFASYDGDTPAELRPGIRKQARIVISNPDMVHTGILPHHTLWAEFLRHLRYVVIDEMHAYRGVFGSHVANVLRRLKRAAAFYGAAPQFILTSATIANPLELADRLIEAPLTLVDNDGAARGEKHVLLYNPPVVDHALGIRRSVLLESVRLASSLLEQNVQTILFGRSRRTVELLLRYMSPAAPAAGAIRGYRSGYLPSQRREIERGLRDGSVRAVAATNALELGIDIGGMDAAILVGYPGTIAATWQQAGRAGRGMDAALAVMVASADPLDQFLVRHPDYIFARSPEHALVNPDNLLILLAHLRCAAFELPFDQGEAFGRVDAARVSEFLAFLAQEGVLHRSGERFFWMADRYPADAVSLRSASADTVVLQTTVVAAEGSAATSGGLASEGGAIIGQVDLASAYWMLHPQAIYLHEGRSFVVDELDLQKNIARLSPVDVDYYTEPRSETTVRLLDKLAESGARGATRYHGEIAVTTQVVGYRKVKWYTHEQLGEGVVSLPPTELHTTGYWFALDERTVAELREAGLWTNAPNDYGPEWPRLRDQVRARDHYRCRGCGAPEDGRGAFHVHHRVPFRAFASRDQANRLDNLVTLCPNCHRRAELAVRLRSGLAGCANLLGHLAPFFLMCDSHDIGIHSDPQSPLAAGQPAIVIYDTVPAGIGFSERLFELHDELVARALELVVACECEDGCPSCVGPGGENGYGGKREARALLEKLA